MKPTSVLLTWEVFWSSWICAAQLDCADQLPSAMFCFGGTDKLDCVQLCSQLLSAAEGWGAQGMLWPTQALQSLSLDFSQVSEWASGWAVCPFTRDNLIQEHEPTSQSHIHNCSPFCVEVRENEDGIEFLSSKSLNFVLKKIGIIAFLEISDIFTGMRKTLRLCPAHTLPVGKLSYYQLPQQIIKFL